MCALLSLREKKTKKQGVKDQGKNVLLKFLQLHEENIAKVDIKNSKPKPTPLVNLHQALQFTPIFYT